MTPHGDIYGMKSTVEEIMMRRFDIFDASKHDLVEDKHRRVRSRNYGQGAQKKSRIEGKTPKKITQRIIMNNFGKFAEK